MNQRRRDNRNRLLKDGEDQMPDGRYRFRYRDESGKRQAVYSWRLDKNDKTPVGKLRSPYLRELEKQIQADLFDHIMTKGGHYTVQQLVEKYVSLRINVRATTKLGYQTVLNILKKDVFGQQRIDLVRLSDAKAWLIKLQQKDGRSYSSIHNIRGVLRPAFQMAVDDDFLRKNPFDFPLASVLVNDSVTRDAITPEQQRKLFNFIQNDSYYCQYYDAIYILFHTGLRISEFCGLTISDIDFTEMKIKVYKQLQEVAHKGIYISPPKTSNGIRDIPMSHEVAECFKRIINNRPSPKIEPIVDGYTGFLCLDSKNKPKLARHWNGTLKYLVKKYNDIYRIPLPNITPHICRHTFCSRMANSGMNPKSLQYIMGHADISVTLNTYTHVNFDDVKNEFKRLES